MKTLRVILSDQLSHNISSLHNINAQDDVILIVETIEEFTYVKHHKKKIVFIISAMRHFALEMEAKGYKVIYVKLDDAMNTGSIAGEIERHVKAYQIKRTLITWPCEYRILEKLKKLSLQFNLEILEDTRFLASLEEFNSWANSRKELRMEFFYRQMRQKHNILIEDSKPIGGKWNYDAENRKFPKGQITIPKHYQEEPDPISLEVIKLVETHFADHFGDIFPFYLSVTRKGALLALELFIETKLKFFGDYQDAMIQNEPWMYHSHISFYLNIGLLEPLECIIKAQEAFKRDNISLNAVEGFIRQILGWREYIRGIYWLKMPAYKEMNFLNATKNLPEFYWTANTKMNCLKQCVTETKQNAYAHHIQRLMVLGNFALLIGISPAQINEWFLIVYADAHEWVELPNVTGMILFADGGYLGSKPYAASGSYINKMSDYCKNCEYKVEDKNGESACPFNYLYWDFLIRNHDKLKSNMRLAISYATIAKMDQTKIDAITYDSEKFLENIYSKSK